jgi:hypothetical protein
MKFLTHAGQGRSLAAGTDVALVAGRLPAAVSAAMMVAGRLPATAVSASFRRGGS